MKVFGDMLGPVMAVWELDPALWSFVLSRGDFVLAALLWSLPALKRELKTRDG